MSFLHHLEWRYATKKFDIKKKIPESDLAMLLEAIRQTPTSFGIMPFRVLVISDPEICEKLQQASYHQPQLGTASHVLVFIARLDLENMIDVFFSELSGGDELKRQTQLAAYESGARAKILSIAKNGDSREYASNQAFIALGFALAAAAELQIDSCAIGWFEADKYCQILQLEEYEFPAVVLPLGYRAEWEVPRPKFRLAHNTVFSYR